MSTATAEQIDEDFTAWLAAVRRSETVAIVDAGREVARLVPAAPSRRMSEWLDAQDERMRRTFGGRVVADSAAVLDDLRSDRQ